MSAKDPHDSVLEAIQDIAGDKKDTGSGIMIVCPFHDDNTPSCGINMSRDGGVPFGYFHCLGCGEKGGWNKLAEKLGLPILKEWELKFAGNGSTRTQRRRIPSDVLYSIDQKDRMFKSINTKEVIPWSEDKDWRGFDGKILRKLEAYMFSDKEEMGLLFPIYVNGKYIGGVKAKMEKPKKGLSYVNTSGKWVRTHGLLGFDYVKKVVKSMKAKKGKCFSSIVLVEGPRDAIRLLLNRIPALAILGIENFTQEKLMKVLSLYGIKTVYVMPDNDKAGTKMYKKIKELAKGYVKVKHIKLPRELNAKGEIIKLDPNEAPQDIIDEVKELIYSEIVPV